MGINLNEGQHLFGLNVDETSKANLLETARWGKFVGIMFSIFIVLMSLLLFVSIFNSQALSFAAVIAVVLITVGINFYPIYALLRFCSQTRSAIQTENQQQWNSGLRSLKNLFKYIGILTIIMVIFYAIMIVAIVANRPA